MIEKNNKLDFLKMTDRWDEMGHDYYVTFLYSYFCGYNLYQLHIYTLFIDRIIFYSFAKADERELWCQLIHEI